MIIPLIAAICYRENILPLAIPMAVLLVLSVLLIRIRPGERDRMGVRDGLFVVGLSSLIIDIPFAPAFHFDAYVTIGAAVLLWLCVLPKQRLARWGGALMLLGYVAYFYKLL